MILTGKEKNEKSQIMMTPKQWLDNLIVVIKIIANKNYQEQVWLGKDAARFSSWGEIVNQFFDDNQIDEFLHGPWKESGLTEAQYLQLVTLRDVMDKNCQQWNDFPDPQKVLISDDWKKVRQTAQDFLNLLSTT